MPETTLDQWLQDTRRFWDAGSEFEARYRRICVDPDIAAATDEEHLRELWNHRTDEELPQLLDGIPLRPEWTCLEIGCGIGRLMKPIAERAHRVIGVDLSAKMLEMSRSYLAGIENVETYVNDGHSLPMIPHASVDFVYSHLAFQHITLYEVVDAYLREIARVLKPGGYCRIQCWREAPTPMVQRIKNIGRRLLGRERYHGPRQWVWKPGREVRFGGVTFHPRDWNRRLRAAGLQPVTLDLGVGHEYWMWSTSRKPA